jgi:single-stranded-DNA-specific exonuclease
MAPHGLDNPEPVFQLLGARVDRVTRVGRDRHVRFMVRDGVRELEAIGFGMGDQADALRAAGRADLVFAPTRNEWRNEMRVQLKLRALRLP